MSVFIKTPSNNLPIRGIYLRYIKKVMFTHPADLLVPKISFSDGGPKLAFRLPNSDEKKWLANLQRLF